METCFLEACLGRQDAIRENCLNNVLRQKKYINQKRSEILFKSDQCEQRRDDPSPSLARPKHGAPSKGRNRQQRQRPSVWRWSAATRYWWLAMAIISAEYPSMIINVTNNHLNIHHLPSSILVMVDHCQPESSHLATIFNDRHSLTTISITM